MRTISSRIHIDATPAQVWAVLVDIDRYHEWNPFIRQAAGTVAPGERLTLTMHPEGGKPMTFNPRVMAACEEEHLRWIGRFILPGIFDGEHYFTLSTDGTFTVVEHGEEFSGLLVPFMGKMLARTERDFRSLNEALAQRVAETATR